MSTGTFAKLEFCPFCGVRGLERDRWGEKREKPVYKSEWICSSCGRGFAVHQSTRGMFASTLAKQHREMRPPDERKVKPRPVDEELNTLQKYAERIGFKGKIRRTTATNKIGFYYDGVCRGTSNFQTGMLILRGYEIRANEEKLEAN